MSPPFRLVLAPRVWREQIPQLVRQGGLGLCHLGRNVHPQARELVAQECRSIQPASQGRQYGPLDDLLLLRVQPQVTGNDARQLIAAFNPLPTQLVTALVLGRGPAAGRWTAAVWENGTVQALGELLLVGPHMRRLSSSRSKETARDIEDNERWSRTSGALGPVVHQRLRKSRVAVIGASRNGSAAALSLAMMGVRELILIDGDTEELHNLNAAVGAAPEGVGRPKVFNRADFLRRIRPDLDVQAIPHSLLHPNCVEALRPVDLIVTCVDRDAARLAVAMLANRRWWCKIHLDIGTGIFREQGRRVMGADVRLLLPGEACVVCLGGLRDLEQARAEVAAPSGALRRGPRLEWHEQRAGSLVTINQVAVNLGIQMWLDLLAGMVTESQWCHLQWDVNGTLQLQQEQAMPGMCDVCRPQGPRDASRQIVGVSDTL
jgi:hypothetical protein